MRPYRGIRIDTGEMVHGYLIGTNVIVGEIVDWDSEYFCTEYWCKVDPKTVGQNTEVHDDEDDNELYVGDIIEMVYEGEKVVGSIQYCGGGYILASDDFVDGFMELSDLTENDGRYFWIPTAEKIDTIYQHPHLLGEAKRS